jgi:phosphatase NudJ
MKNSLFVLVVVPEADGRYLMVRERDGTYYLPAGKVEPGENLMAAAVRETAEEAGVVIGLRGILGLDHVWVEARGRLRFCFVGYRALATPPKTQPDEHSLGAVFVSRREIAALPLRHPEVLKWLDHYERAAPLLPCAAYSWAGPNGPGFRAVLG